jgi:DNA-binding beta-propeller fold protein YncE
MERMKKVFVMAAVAAAVLAGCRTEEAPVGATDTMVTDGAGGAVAGFFLLNEGNMGSNKASLDYFDYATGHYRKNIYAERNPGVVKELGDVGNDLKIYGGKLYAVVNCSHLVEVMDVRSARHVAAIGVPNCRYVAFDGGFAYVSSYAGPVQIDPSARLGYVVKIDTVSMRAVDTCVVGYQPDELVVRGDKLYVANSGGYRVPSYDNTVSVIDLPSFEEIGKITVGVNLHRMVLDARGDIWVSSRGDYRGAGSKIYVIDADERVSDVLEVPVSNWWLSGDSLFVCSTEWSEAAGRTTVSYAVVDTRTRQVVSRNFIADGTEQQIAVPYGIAVNPATKEIFVTDAKDYVTPGKIYCFSPDGRYKWDATTGDIPAHIVFTEWALINNYE